MRDHWPWVLVASLCVGCGHAPDKEKAVGAKEAPLPVLRAPVLRVELAPWPEIVKNQGSLISDEETIVGAKVGGRVAEMLVDLGDDVADAAALATIDQAEFKLEIVLAEAQLTQSRAALGLAPIDAVANLNPENAPPVREAKAIWDEVKTRIERVRDLASRNAVTKDALEQAVADEAVASARHSAALNGVREKIALIGVREAELSVAKQRLDETMVQAPFAGRVKHRHVARGTYLQVGQPIVTLVRTSKLRFRGTVPERQAHRLRLGQQVTLRIDSQSAPRVVKITRISPGVDEFNRSLAFEAEVENKDGTLRAGMFAEAEVIVDAAAETLAIPDSAITEFAGVEKVWKVVNGVAKETAVTTARRSGKAVEIAPGTGLEPGDVILAKASEGLVASIEPTGTRTTAEVLALRAATNGGAFVEREGPGTSNNTGAPSE